MLPGCECSCCFGVYGDCPGVIQAPPGLGDADVDVGATSLNIYLIFVSLCDNDLSIKSLTIRKQAI